MKKSLFLILLIIFSTPLFSQDLWNGLKSGMSYEEVKQIVAKNCEVDLKDNTQWLKKKSTLLNGDAYEKYIGFSGNYGTYGSKKMWFETVYFHHLTCQFYNGKLFAVDVLWETSLDLLKTKTDERFGQSRYIASYDNVIPDTYLYQTRNSNILVFIFNFNVNLYETDPNYTSYFVIDTSVPKKIKQELTDEVNNSITKQREQEAENADKIKF